MEELVARINELSRKNKSVGLTPEEVTERDELRQQYLAQFRQNFRDQLDTIKFAEDDDEAGKGKKH